MAHTGWFGQGWTLDFWRELHLGERHHVMVDDQGRRVAFDRIAVDDTSRRDFNTWDKLTHYVDAMDGYVVEDTGGQRYIFGLPEANGNSINAGTLPLREIRDRNGNALKLYYHPENGLPTHVVDAAGHIVALQFETVGTGDGETAHLPRLRLTEAHQVVRLPNSNGNSNGNSNSNSNSNSKSTSKPGTSAELSEFKSIARLAKYDYSPEGDLIRVTNRIGQVTREYAYRNHVMVMHRDAAGLQAHYEYDQGDQPTPKSRVLRHWTNDGTELRFGYDPVNRQTIVINQADQQHRYLFDADKRYIGEVDALGGTKRYSYNASGDLIETIDELGRSTRFQYDGQGNVTGVTDAQGNRQTITIEPHLNAPVAVSDAAGNTWTYAYDARGNIQSQTDPLGHTTTYVNDTRGLPVEITDAKGGLKTIVWNDEAQIASYTDCSQRTTRYAYDTNAQLTHITDAADHVTRLTPDLIGRVHAIQHADGSQEQFTYDSANRLIAYHDPNGVQTQYSLNLAGLPIQRTDALGHTLRYGYDSLSRLVALENENKSVASFQYDALDRLVQETGFDGRIQSYTYNGAGELTQKLDAPHTPHEIRSVYQRDILGRLVQKTTASEVTRLQYDALGQLTAAINPAARLAWQFDALGNVLAETSLVQGIESTLTHAYDPLGNRTAMTLPDGRTVNWLYYGSGHLHQVNLDGEPLCDLERDRLHREVQRSQGALTHHFDYDALGRLVGQSVQRDENRSGPLHSDQSNQATSSRNPVKAALHRAIIQRQYRYDRAGHLTGIQDNRRGDAQYQYDPLGRITSAQRSGLTSSTERFSFDPAHNMLAPATSGASSSGTGTPTTGLLKNNRLEVFEDKRFKYDPHGNLIQKKSGAHTVQTLRYDAEHQLVEVQTTRGLKTKNNPEATPITQTVTFAYDALGRRVTKRDALGHTRFVWDGNRMLSETRGAKTDPAQTQTTTQNTTTHTQITLYEPDSFVPMVRLDEVTQQSEAASSEIGSLGREPDNSGNDADGDDKYDITQDDDYLDPSTLYALPEARRQAAILAFMAEVQASTQKDKAKKQQQKEATITRQRQVLYYQVDHLGTPQELTNAQGDIVWQATYAAWGNTLRIETPGVDDGGGSNNNDRDQRKELTPFHDITPRKFAQNSKTAAANEARFGPIDALQQNLRFQGQYFDAETGLHYNRFRYYDPDVGRFVNQDLIGLEGGMNLSRYTPNPITWLDPLGLSAGDPCDLPCPPGFVDPKTINFSQRTVSENVETYKGDMEGGKWDWAKSGPLRVINMNGSLVSYDNRRLMAARLAGVKCVPIQKVDPSAIMPGSKSTWGGQV